MHGRHQALPYPIFAQEVNFGETLDTKQFHRGIKVYEDMRFLESKEARALRILAEYLEPLSRFQRNEVRDTIVFMGSARLVSRARWPRLR